MRLVFAVVVASMLALAGCAAGSSATPGPPVTRQAVAPSLAADGPDDFYGVPAASAGEPGAIIRFAEVDSGMSGARAWKVLYHSRSVTEKDIAVSGYVVAPAGDAPAGGWPVFAWGHGTTGMADRCAPTRMGSPASEITNLADLVSAGFVVAATDYEGLGTPGVHPYGVGESEARGMLDSVRAARNLADAHAGSRVILGGQSQGGGAALTAAEVTGSYAPELQVLGAVATAPRTELATIGAVLPNTPYFGYLVMVGVAFDSVYGTHLVDDLLTPEGKASLGVLDTECVDGILARYAGVPPSTILAKDPMTEPGLADLLAKNTPGNVKTDVPILVMHGSADTQIPPLLSNLFTRRACATGDTVELRYYPGQGHGGPLRQEKDAILQWLADRLAGRAAASSCGAVPEAP